MLSGINEFGRLKRLAMRRPAEAFVDDARIDSEWRDLNYHYRPDLAKARAEHDRFAEIIRSVGADASGGGATARPATGSLTAPSPSRDRRASRARCATPRRSGPRR